MKTEIFSEIDAAKATAGQGIRTDGYSYVIILTPNDATAVKVEHTELAPLFWKDVPEDELIRGEHKIAYLGNKEFIRVSGDDNLMVVKGGKVHQP